MDIHGSRQTLVFSSWVCDLSPLHATGARLVAARVELRVAGTVPVRGCPRATPPCALKGGKPGAVVHPDDYYHLLVPVTVPVAVVAVYLNWFSINLFKSS